MRARGWIALALLGGITGSLGYSLWQMPPQVTMAMADSAEWHEIGANLRMIDLDDNVRCFSKGATPETLSCVVLGKSKFEPGITLNAMPYQP